MAKSKRSNEGYLLLDHSNSPGLGEEVIHGMGDDLPLNAGRGKFEAPTYTCSHCQAIVILNPLRQRERHYCTGCDHYICDTCGAIRAQTMECKTFLQIADEIQNRSVKRIIDVPFPPPGETLFHYGRVEPSKKLV